MDFINSPNPGKFFLIALACMSIWSCGPSKPINGDEDVIGRPPEKVSPMNKLNGEAKVSLIMQDKSTRRLQKFDTSIMKHQWSLSVAEPQLDHYVLNADNESYFIDLFENNMAIYGSDSRLIESDISFSGSPISSALRSDLGLFLVYDKDLNVTLVKLNSTGRIIDSFRAGNRLAGTNIRAGDFSTGGTLVLSLTDGTLALINAAGSVTKHEWQYEIWDSGVHAINWVAPIPNKADLVMVKTSTSLSVLDIVQRSVIATKDISGLQMLKLSKDFDPHYLGKGDDGSLHLFYFDGTKIQEVIQQRPEQYTLSSHLNVSENYWSMVTSDSVSRSWTNDEDEWTEQRHWRRFRLSDLLSSQVIKLPDLAQLHMNSKFVFALHPSELGWAERYNQDRTVQEAKFFNFRK